jgi:stearoyl-CoA desaturase (delta-9 desaturase)
VAGFRRLRYRKLRNRRFGYAASRGTASTTYEGFPMALVQDFEKVDDGDAIFLSTPMKITIGIFVVGPTLALLGVIPMIYWGLVSWVDIGLLVGFWALTGLGITVGYHRFFTHGSFKAPRPVKIALAIMGSYALEGSINQWVADHRKHHKFSDEIGDPHSPWRFGTSRKAIGKGLVFAHMGWLFSEEQATVDQYAPDIRDDKDLQRINNAFPIIVVMTFLLPGIIGGLITWSWLGFLTGMFWGGVVRVAFVHHVTWSINSICHVFGKRPFKSRDLSSNVNWLAIPSFGESWHNLHHVDPTCARHGVLKGQIDPSAGVIRMLERVNLAHDVRWPKPERLAKKLIDPSMAPRIRGYQPPATADSASASSTSA